MVVAFLIGIKVRNNILDKEQRQLEENYLTNYKTAYDSLLISASKCEKITSVVHTVWSKNIKNTDTRNDFETNISYLYTGDDYKDDWTKYVHGVLIYGYGYDLKRFGLTINDIEEFRELVSSVAENDSIIQNQIKTLQSPPDKFTELYNQILLLYDNYSVLSAQSQNPNGNLTSFTSEINDKKDDFLAVYEKIQLLLPD